MNLFWALLILFVLYPLCGTLLFALVEKLTVPKKGKVLIMTLGHPILTAFTIWVTCSPFNNEIAVTGILAVAGSMLRVPFSNIKYFCKLHTKGNAISIDYLNPLLKHKTIEITLEQIEKFSLSTSKRLINKPTILELTIADETIKFYTLGPPTEELIELANSLHLSNLVKE